MLRTRERIDQVKAIAYENLKNADNWAHHKDLDKDIYWSLYPADVRELLSLIEDMEGELE